MINLTNIINASGGYVGMIQGMNAEINYMFGFGLLITLYIILFASALKSGVKQALGFSATACMIIAILFRLLSLINDQILYATIVIEAISVVILYFDKQD